MLRHNRKAHDLTLECRSSKNAEIIFFTPLRLDSINSKHFNYANLYYRLIEHQHNLYVVFVRELNLSKTLFFTRIDSLGKHGPFIEVLGITREANWEDFDLNLHDAGNGQILIESHILFSQNNQKKSILCYDLAKQRRRWSLQLPPENKLSGYSTAFTADDQALYYILLRSEITGYKRKYDKHRQLLLPDLFHDSLYLARLSLDGQIFRKSPCLSALNHVHSLRLHSDSNSLRLYAQVSRTLSVHEEANLLFYAAAFEKAALRSLHEDYFPLSEDLNKRLKYFDGTDSDRPSDKDFTLLKEWHTGTRYLHLTERKEGGIYKELLLWEYDEQTNRLVNCGLIPRRMLSSETWSKFPDIGEALLTGPGEDPSVYLAEAPENNRLDPNTAQYYDLVKQSTIRGCNLVQYRITANKRLEKKVLYRNTGFDMIPTRVEYSGRGPLIFYLSNGKQEKFAWPKP